MGAKQKTGRDLKTMAQYNVSIETGKIRNKGESLIEVCLELRYCK